MRRLLMLRHAKSSWAESGVPDHDRALNKRGRDAARRMGEALRDERLVPELVLSSSARRARETVARLALPDETAIEIEHDLYMADPDAVVDRIRGVDEAVSVLMVVGHNPTTHEVALLLTGSGDDEARERMAANYPTGALAVVRFEQPWSAVAPADGFLERFLIPRELD